MRITEKQAWMFFFGAVFVGVVMLSSVWLVAATLA